jgi:catechol 2,3-dioxygenase-like lactoylglutathione lyase family enzyme
MGAGRLEHLTITASDLVAALAFYDAALGALGLVRLDELVDEEEDDAPVEAAAWGSRDGQRVLWVVTSWNRSTPRRWTIYRRGEYGATVVDPDGNLIEAVTDE